MAQIVGVDVTETSATALHNLGARFRDEVNGKEYVYVQADAGGATGAGYVVLINRTFAADMIDTTNSANARGLLVGVAPVAVTASHYFWAQIWGAANIRVAASAAASVALNTTATAGQVDDDASVGAEVVENLVLTTANGGAAGTAAGFLSYPTVRATL